jgi:sec-independent protein translocase protein TatB
MFGVDSGELFIIALVAIVVIGPKELPRVMRTVGSWVGKARGMANQFRSGVDQMVRESEIADLEQKWREQNEAIMRANPLASDSGWGLPPPPPPPPAPVLLDKTDAAPPSDPPLPPPMPVILGKVVIPVDPSAPPPRRKPVVPALVRPATAPPRTDLGGEAA